VILSQVSGTLLQPTDEQNPPFFTGTKWFKTSEKIFPEVFLYLVLGCISAGYKKSYPEYIYPKDFL